MSPTYVITNDGLTVASVSVHGDGIVATTPTGRRQHPSLAETLDAEPTLVTVDATGAWSIQTDELSPWPVAECLLGRADRVEINDTGWSYFSEQVGWVPEDTDELADKHASVVLHFTTPGFGSPGGSPSWNVLGERVGDLWHATCSEEVTLSDPWKREADGSRIALWLMDQDAFGPLTSIDDPWLAPDDASSVREIVGPPDENGWVSIWVNGDLWFVGAETWERAPDVPPGPLPSALGQPKRMSVRRSPGSFSPRTWSHYRVGSDSDGTDGPVTSLLLLPGDAPDRDLLRIVHAGATSRPVEVAQSAAVAVVEDAEGRDWVGIAWVHPDLAERLERAVPGAAALYWDDEHDELLLPGTTPGPLLPRALSEVERSIPDLARRMDELDPLGHERFTGDPIGMRWG